MKHYKVKQYTRQAGMTLIELTVVLLVLIGLAGLLIPYVTGFMAKTHDSTGSFNSAALDNTMQRFMTDKMRAPNNMESLIQTVAGTGAAGANCDPAGNGAVGLPYCKLMTTTFYTVQAAAAPRNMSLSAAGITSVYNMDPSTDNATFNSTVAASTPIVPATNLAIVATDGTSIESHLASAFERNINSFDATCYDYVVFGIGDKTDLIGSAMSTAPVHFASQGAMGPANRYNRFVTVWQVDKINAAGTANAPGGLPANTTGDCSASVEPAKFIGAAMTMGAASGHLWGTSHSLAHTWENVAAN
jgi:type II secretory pathway pseudopilin PulG